MGGATRRLQVKVSPLGEARVEWVGGRGRFSSGRVPEDLSEMQLVKQKLGFSG